VCVCVCVCDLQAEMRKQVLGLDSYLFVFLPAASVLQHVRHAHLQGEEEMHEHTNIRVPSLCSTLPSKNYQRQVVDTVFHQLWRLHAETDHAFMLTRAVCVPLLPTGVYLLSLCCPVPRQMTARVLGSLLWEPRGQTGLTVVTLLSLWGVRNCSAGKIFSSSTNSPGCASPPGTLARVWLSAGALLAGWKTNGCVQVQAGSRTDSPAGWGDTGSWWRSWNCIFLFLFHKAEKWVDIFTEEGKAFWVRTAPVMSHGVVCWFGVGDCAVGVFMCE